MDLLTTIWELINPHFYLIIAIPCMSMFPFRYSRRRKALCITLAVLVASAVRYGAQLFIIECFRDSAWWPSFLLDQTVYTLCLILACLILYKGNPLSMILTILLAMSLAAQCGFIIGGCIEYVWGPDYFFQLVIPRDILGYGTFAAYYLLLWKYSNLTSFYLNRRDHLILLFAALATYLLTCSFTNIFELGNPVSILFYAACLFSTCSTTFLIFRFTKEQQNMQEQQLIIQDMKLSENTLDQMKETEAQMRELKHELTNYFIYAQELARNGEMEELTQYLSSLTSTALPSIDSTVLTNHPVIDAILSQKNAYAKSLGIDIEMNVSLPDTLAMDNRTLCSLFGNLLNNAIEACKGQKHPFIRLNVCPIKSYLVFRTDNSVTYDVLKNNPELLSTKEDANNHGIGTKVLRKIAEQYDGILSYEMTSPTCFTVQVLLKLEPCSTS